MFELKVNNKYCYYLFISKYWGKKLMILNFQKVREEIWLIGESLMKKIGMKSEQIYLCNDK